MGQVTISAEMTVARAMQSNPAVGPVLIARRTACVGCYLARFCTLRDAANYYHLHLQDFIDELKLTSSGHVVSKGESNA